MRELVIHEIENVSGGKLTPEDWLGVGLVALNLSMVGQFFAGPFGATVLGSGSVGAFALLDYLEMI